jgi:hypothetical protein
MTEQRPEQEKTTEREVREPDVIGVRKRPETLADIEPTPRTLRNVLRKGRVIS